VIGVESVQGVLRELVLAPRLGDFRSRQAGVFTGSILILSVAYIFSNWLRVIGTKALIAIGLLWVALTLVFELGLGRLVFHRPWENLAADYDVARGGLLPFGLVLLALAPLLAAKLRGITASRRSV